MCCSIILLSRARTSPPSICCLWSVADVPGTSAGGGLSSVSGRYSHSCTVRPNAIRFQCFQRRSRPFASGVVCLVRCSGDQLRREDTRCRDREVRNLASPAKFCTGCTCGHPVLEAPAGDQALFRNGWLHTGDIARADERGISTSRSQEGHDRKRRFQHLPTRCRGYVCQPTRTSPWRA